MSNGDDEADADANGEESAPEADADTESTVDTFQERLAAAESDLEAAETEADLDAVEADLDAIESDLEDADLPEPAEDEDGDEEGEAEDPREDFESRLSDLRDQLEDERGPYAADVLGEVESAQSTVVETRWTRDGLPEVVTAVQSYLDRTGNTLDANLAVETDDLDLAEEEDEVADRLAAALDDAMEAIEEADLDPDDDVDTIAALLESAETLTADLEAAEEWDDLSIREQLHHEGFYDVLESESRKDFPPEWSAVKLYQKRNEPEPILFALDRLDSDFMEDKILLALERMAAPEAFEEMHQRAQKRNKQPIKILGRIGDDRALETLHEFVDGDGDPALQKVTLRAIGQIGSDESTQPVANRLEADNYEIRSSAARALGLIGDTRAIGPLAHVLENDEADEVRASAAWALNQIGTERARDVLADYADDRAYTVQAEAEKAV